MIDHFGINCADLNAAKVFYDAVLAPLGFSRQMDFGVAIGYGTAAHPSFWISTVDGVGPNRETHIAFTAESPEQVRAFHAAAVEQGAESLHAPRIWPEYHERYYGAFVRDPDGNTSRPSATRHPRPTDCCVKPAAPARACARRR